MYRSLNSELKKEFGCKVYKLALSGGMTCPNRDGKIGTRGCIFCAENGSGYFAQPVCGSITEQIEKAKALVAKKAKNCKYIAYFQSFTNTYAPVSYLEALFTEAIRQSFPMSFLKALKAKKTASLFLLPPLIPLLPARAKPQLPSGSATVCAESVKTRLSRFASRPSDPCSE